MVLDIMAKTLYTSKDQIRNEKQTAPASLYRGRTAEKMCLFLNIYQRQFSLNLEVALQTTCCSNFEKHHL